VSAMPLRVEPFPAPAYEVRRVACPMCDDGIYAETVNLRTHQDGRRVTCAFCGGDGEVTVHLGEIDGELLGWLPRHEVLVPFSDEADVDEGGWAGDCYRPNLRSIEDVRRVEELGGDL
jgi:hypothetical protein